MNPRTEFITYVAELGGVPEASKALDIPYPTLASICNGHRGISKDMAELLAERSKGRLDASRLVWIRKTKEPSPDSTAANDPEPGAANG